MAPDLPLWEGILRLLLAFVLAAAIGFERELREQEAGLRTHIFVATGAGLFVLVGNYAWEDLTFGNNAGVVLDPSRVVAYVITGIGFLGAGAILKDGVSVRGLTTAASLWVTAAIGATCAAGEYVWATVVTAIILISLWPLRRLAEALELRTDRSTWLRVELHPDGRVADVARALEERGIEVQSMTVSEDGEARRVDMVVTGATRVSAVLLDAVGRVPRVTSASLVD